MSNPSMSEYSSYEVLRPGFTRLNLPWFASDEEVDFVLEALALTCESAWRLMPQYRFNNETGEWKHFDNLEYRERKWLGNISYASGKFEFRQQQQGRNSIALLKSQQTFQQTFQQSFQYYGGVNSIEILKIILKILLRF